MIQEDISVPKCCSTGEFLLLLTANSLYRGKNSFRPKYGITEQRHGYRGTMRLIVRNFSPSDVGTYHCVSTNSLGKAEGTLRLYGEWKFTSFFLHLPLSPRFAEGLLKNGLYVGWGRDGKEQDKAIAQSFLSFISSSMVFLTLNSFYEKYDKIVASTTHKKFNKLAEM